MARAKTRRVKTPNGAGSVILRSDGRWMARYSTSDPETGLPARKALYGRTEQEARAKLIQALADHGRGRLPFVRGRSPTLEQYAERWLAASRVRVKTALRYQELLRRHVFPSLGRIQLARLEPQHIDGLLRAKHSAGVAAKTCNHIRSTLRTCLSDALREGLVARNAAALAKPLRLDDARESLILTLEHIHVLLRVADRHRDGPLWVVALATGARQSELLGLRWSTADDPRGDVDLEAKTIRIARTLQRTPRPYRGAHGDWMEQATKTRRSTRTVPIAEVACAHLRLQRALQAEERLRAGRKWTDRHGDLVFRRPDGGPISGNHLSRSLQRALTAAGLPPIRFHDLCHATATFLALQKVPVAVTMAVLGHANASTMLDIYTRVAPDLAPEAAEAMDRVLCGMQYPNPSMIVEGPAIQVAEAVTVAPAVDEAPDVRESVWE